MTDDQITQLVQAAIGRGLQINVAGGEEMMSVAATCRFFGGDKPLHPSTLYRGVKSGRYPPPVKVGGSSRWRRSECVAIRDGLSAIAQAAKEGD